MATNVWERKALEQWSTGSIPRENTMAEKKMYEATRMQQVPNGHVTPPGQDSEEPLAFWALTQPGGRQITFLGMKSRRRKECHFAEAV